jgi:ComF family protein
MTVTEFFTEKLLPLVLPMACLACERVIDRGRHFVGLCVRCRGRLSPLRGQRCASCGRPLRGARLPTGFQCGSCRRRPPGFDQLIALWPYAPPIDSVVRGLKFRRLDYLGDHLAREMACRIRAERLAIDLVVWVPLHWRRHLARGYNQAECIARPLAEELHRPARRALVRGRATPAQTSLAPAERAINLRGAMSARPRVDVIGKHILLVDDVFTTGATLRAAATSLVDAGASRVTAAVAARTPGPGEQYARKTIIW